MTPTMRRLKVANLEVGDIILTTTNKWMSRVISFFTRSDISHAMLYTGHSSVIHAVGEGVHSENVQRIFFEPGLAVHVLRLSGLPSQAAIDVCDHVRCLVGTQYTTFEAMTSVVGFQRTKSSNQFCSRLVAEAYQNVAYGIVDKSRTASPGKLLKSQKLIKIFDVVEDVSKSEYDSWQKMPSIVSMMTESTNTLLNGIRRINKRIQNQQDIIDHLLKNPKDDEKINDLYKSSGYLKVHNKNLVENSWQYRQWELDQQGLLYPDFVRNYCKDAVSQPVNKNRYFKMFEVYNHHYCETNLKTFNSLRVLYTELSDLRPDFPPAFGRVLSF